MRFGNCASDDAKVALLTHRVAISNIVTNDSAQVNQEIMVRYYGVSFDVVYSQR